MFQRKLRQFKRINEKLQKCSSCPYFSINSIINTDYYVDKNGVKHYDYSFIANKISFLTTARKEIKKQLEEDAFQKMANKIEEEMPW